MMPIGGMTRDTGVACRHGDKVFTIENNSFQERGINYFLLVECKLFLWPVSVPIFKLLSLIRIISLHGHLDHVSAYDVHLLNLLFMHLAHRNFSNTIDQVSEVEMEAL